MLKWRKLSFQQETHCEIMTPMPAILMTSIMYVFLFDCILFLVYLVCFVIYGTCCYNTAIGIDEVHSLFIYVLFQQFHDSVQITNADVAGIFC